MTAIALVALDPEAGEIYEIDTRRSGLGLYQGTVTGPFGTITGDPYALQQLGQALQNAAASAGFALVLRVDECGPLQPDEPPTPDLTSTSDAAAAAHEAWGSTVLIWARAGACDLPVERSDWTGDGHPCAATAVVDEVTDLHFADGQLTVRSRCRHGRVHRRQLEHPDDLADARHEAEYCPGHHGTP
ncbi:hypothetical protein [Streptomyces sp. NPDC001404]|uniref:hypothetical protein n=1 Tax=Streptomyces sp. NPDC001404 TaxID=3364571 RepID=UPI0036901F81